MRDPTNLLTLLPSLTVTVRVTELWWEESTLQACLAFSSLSVLSCSVLQKMNYVKIKLYTKIGREGWANSSSLRIEPTIAILYNAHIMYNCIWTKTPNRAAKGSTLLQNNPLCPSGYIIYLGAPDKTTLAMKNFENMKMQYSQKELLNNKCPLALLRT